jgi:hypothetical protein
MPHRKVWSMASMTCRPVWPTRCRPRRVRRHRPARSRTPRRPNPSGRMRPGSAALRPTPGMSESYPSLDESIRAAYADRSKQHRRPRSMSPTSEPSAGRRYEPRCSRRCLRKTNSHYGFAHRSHSWTPPSHWRPSPVTRWATMCQFAMGSRTRQRCGRARALTHGPLGLWITRRLGRWRRIFRSGSRRPWPSRLRADAGYP